MALLGGGLILLGGGSLKSGNDKMFWNKLMKHPAVWKDEFKKKCEKKVYVFGNKNHNAQVKIETSTQSTEVIAWSFFILMALTSQ